jgi:magnesium chelatase family protein
MLAKRISGILPPLSFPEALETTQVHSVAGTLPKGVGLLAERPFRSPHHSVSDAGLIGGGSGTPRPGEVSLAHNGVLFLDELPEFPRNVLEQLRQPLEEGTVTIARANMTLTFPASFMMVTAMNPCQCGFFGDPSRECRCTGGIIQRYLGKISGPLLDRIDLHIEVPAVPYQELRSKDTGAGSSEMRGRVAETRAIQQARGFNNANIPVQELRKLCNKSYGVSLGEIQSLTGINSRRDGSSARTTAPSLPTCRLTLNRRGAVTPVWKPCGRSRIRTSDSRLKRAPLARKASMSTVPAAKAAARKPA